MAFIQLSFAVCFLFYFVLYSPEVIGEIQIVEPLPGHPVLIEGEQARITCVAYDIQNITKPANISFLRVLSRYGDKSPPIPDGGKNGNYTFETKTELNGLRLSVTMVINNMSSHIGGRYECSAWRPPDNSGKKALPAGHGFTILYVPKKDLPQLNYSRSVTTEFNKPVNLYCSLTTADNKVSTNIVKLEKIAWFKNDVLTGKEVVHLEDRLPNINLKMNSPSDAGKYTCRLTTTLGLTRKYDVSGTINVGIIPRFPPIPANTVGDDGYEATLEKYEIIRKKGESVKFACIAEGNPIQIVWKKKPKSGETKIINQTALINGLSHYRFSNDKNRFKDFWMEILDVSYDDRGEYSCCFQIGNSENCQKFTLRVKDPLGWLWPLIGIIIQAILIVLILFFCSRAKKGSTKSKTVKQTDLSYIFTDDGGKGHIRLRNTGARND